MWVEWSIYTFQNKYSSDSYKFLFCSLTSILQSCKILKSLILSEISDRVNGSRKSFLLFFNRLRELFFENTGEDGCTMWMTPANSHLYSLSQTLAL